MKGVRPVTKLRNERTRYRDEDERKAPLAACKASRNPQLYSIVACALCPVPCALWPYTGRFALGTGVAVFRNTKHGDTRAVTLESVEPNLAKRSLGLE